jgi:CitMHS family citrate-Mg2+:H+ or citrate-Ca2+:H+ symporter
MLTIIGISIIVLILVLILTKTTSALTALLLVPVVGALVAGFGLETATFAVEGIKNIAPIACTFVFAILFFGTLTDAGLFDPVIDRILKAAGGSPTKITVGAAALAMIVHLDGSGAVTFMITVPAMLPIFQKLGMDRKVLACVIALGAGAMSLVPWSGPNIRAASVLAVDVTEIYRPIMIPHLCGLVTALLIAWYLGHRESKRLGYDSKNRETGITIEREISAADLLIRRPRTFWFNVVLTVVVIASLMASKVSPAIVFMLGSTLALMVNYPKLKQQRERIDAHAKTGLLMASILFAAGIFTGIMKNTGMIDAMAGELVAAIPEGAGKFIPLGLAAVSMPLSMFFDPDSFYFGILPVLAEVGANMGVDPVTMGQAALMGQMTVGFPLSPLTPATFLLIGLAGIELAEHQKQTFKFSYLISLVMVAVAVLMGIISI